MAHRGGRIIDTDTLRIFSVVQVSSDGQEREQDSDDNPNINAHQRSPAVALPLNNLASRQYMRSIFDRLYVASDRKSSHAKIPGRRGVRLAMVESLTAIDVTDLMFAASKTSTRNRRPLFNPATLHQTWYDRPYDGHKISSSDRENLQ
jgi:hypothetical protein